MKCSRCNHDSKYRERPKRVCPRCHGLFAFEPREGDAVTDMLFKHALEAVSEHGQVRFGVENLYYEVCRRKRRRPTSWLVTLVVLGGSLGSLAVGLLPSRGSGWLILAFFLGCLSLRYWYVRWQAPYVCITPDTFRSLYDRWCAVHGQPAGVIQRREAPTPAQPVEPDLGDYSFDRAVICDRARTVDLLLANHFHFENNCAILTLDGYPPGPFATVRRMLQRNPNLRVFVLHDATPTGCRLAYNLAHDREWFPPGVRFIDVGLRPGQARPLLGCWQRAASRQVQDGPGLTAREAAWLARHRLELAAIRPAQVIRRLFRAINSQAVLDTDTTATAEAQDHSTVSLFLDRDEQSFTTDADALDSSGDVDGFG